MDEIKRLTPVQRARCNRLIRRLCANYDGGNCLPLDDGEGCVCVQTISYSLLCKYFRRAVLPADKVLCADIYRQRTRPGPSARERAWCSFPASGRPPPQSGRRSPRRRRHGWSGRAPARPPAEKPAPFPHRKARRSGTFCHAPRRRCSLPFLFGDGSLSAPPFPDKAVFSLSSLPFSGALPGFGSGFIIPARRRLRNAKSNGKIPKKAASGQTASPPQVM